MLLILIIDKLITLQTELIFRDSISYFYLFRKSSDLKYIKRTKSKQKPMNK